MRKLLATVPAVVLALTLTACGGDDENESTPTDNSSTSTPTDEPSDTPTEEPTEEPTDEPTDEPTEEPSDEPAGDVQEFATDDYTTSVPADWEDSTEAASGAGGGAGGLVQAAFSAPAKPGAAFTTNANGVAVEGAPQLEGDALVEAFEKEVKTVVDETEFIGTQDVDGEEGVAFKSTLSTGGVDITLYQMQVYHNDKSFVFTVTTDEAGLGEEVFNQAVSDWSWTS